MYFQLVKTSAGWHARIKGANHEIVFSSQVYTTKQSAINACNMVIAGAASASIYEATA